ncbi:site-specific recombinase, phage integrase family [Oesophagostomum dentatum]|uniref:Site-specific recombinase, phage integrase family n=1 Tax=Oesophagostomum dentatum TaxID=61180 RepID=A0A0B1TNU1_OESDE|nr:site-specific recombinase, phage integrase family [Oesophagostomum dentatum]
MDNLAQVWKNEGFSTTAVSIIMASWSKNTAEQYNSCLKNWIKFAEDTNCGLTPTPTSLCNFLAYINEKGRSFSTIASHKAAITTFFDNLCGSQLSADPTLKRFMKGLFRKNPSKARYSSTWDVGTVLSYLEELGPNQCLGIRMLTLKLAFLLSICSPRRVSEIASLSLASVQKQPEKWTFFLDYRNKNRTNGPPHSAVYETFYENSLLCPVKCLVDYLNKTKEKRGNEQRLLLSYVTFKPVSPSTVARWVKEVLSMAGIPMKFTAHSTRSASTSKALKSGASLKIIMKAACWSEKSQTFQQFYCRSDEPTFQSRVLSR